MSLSTRELRDTVDRMSYKPGWSFQLDELTVEQRLLIFGQDSAATTRNTLIVWAQVQNSLPGKQDETITFGLNRVIPDGARATTDLFLSWVKDVLLEAEYHELREFFRCDGLLVDNPHATKAVPA